MTFVLRYAVRSDRGYVRANNEDSVFAGPRLLALADGMGGHAAGEVASQIIISAFAPLDNDEPSDDLLNQLHEALDEGNVMIREEAESHPELEGMGTTLTAMLFSDNILGLCHVGDSRAYLFRDGELTQITRDDTFVQSLVDQGRITADEAHVHPQRSLIMRALTGEPVEPTLAIREVAVGDRYLICSDGLSDPVSAETIEDTMGSATTPEECAERLVELALRSGGPDNITLVVADIVDDDFGSTQPVFAGSAAQFNEDIPRPDTSAGRAATARGTSTTTVVEGVTQTPRPFFTRKIVIATIIALILILCGAYVGIRALWNNSFFVGTEGDPSQVSIFQGISSAPPGLPAPKQYAQICLENDSVILQPVSVKTPCVALTMRDLKPNVRNELSSGKTFRSYEATRDYALRAFHDGLLPRCEAGAKPKEPGRPVFPDPHEKSSRSIQPPVTTGTSATTGTNTTSQAQRHLSPEVSSSPGTPSPTTGPRECRMGGG